MADHGNTASRIVSRSNGIEADCRRLVVVIFGATAHATCRSIVLEDLDLAKPKVSSSGIYSKNVV